MASTADSYLSPALSLIAKRLRMSESLAGVTLLALGNGAPDVFASFSAAEGSSEGFYMAAATLLGSGLFITGIITSIISVVMKKNIKVTPSFFVRDIIFFIFSLLLFAYGLLIKKRIDKILSYYFLGLYAIYVGFVIAQDKWVSSE